MKEVRVIVGSGNWQAPQPREVRKMQAAVVVDVCRLRLLLVYAGCGCWWMQAAVVVVATD